MPIFATAKSKLYIGGVLPTKNSDFIEADFTTALAGAVEIAPLESLGSVGDTSEAVTFDAIGNARRMKLKGIRDAGNMEVIAGIDYADEGQIALLAAEKTPHDYAFRLVFNDAPEGGTPSERLFIAKVMSVSEAFDEANSVMKLSASLAVNSNVVRIIAAETP